MKLSYIYNINITILLIIASTLLLSNISLIKSDALCSLRTLRKEIEEDIADNGMLDCLRNVDSPHFKTETEEEKNKRIKSQWDTDCSFEADTDWENQISKNLGINELCDVNGEVSKINFNDEAVMCVIVRSALCKGLFDNYKDIKYNDLPRDLQEKVDCAGPLNDNEGPKICAANAKSFFSADSWIIMYGGDSIKIKGNPEFVKKIDDDVNTKQNQYEDSILPQNIKDLTKFSKEQLEDHQGELAKLIDGKSNRNIGGEFIKRMTSSFSNSNNKYNKKEQNVYFHIKKKEAELDINSNTSPEVNNNGNNNSNSNSNNIDYSSLSEFNISTTDNLRTIFGFYMINYKLNDNKGEFKSRLVLNNKEIQETKQVYGVGEFGHMSGGFLQQLTNKDTNALTVQYKSTSRGHITINGDLTNNLAYGVITFPKESSIMRHVANNSISLTSTGTHFRKVDSFDLAIRNDTNKERLFLIMYNVSLNLRCIEGCDFGTMLKLNHEKDLKDTKVTKTKTQFFGGHGSTIQKIPQGESTASLYYMYKANQDRELKFQNEEKDYNQSITAFMLPESTKVLNCNLKNSFELKAETWKAFALKSDHRDEKLVINVLENFEKYILFVYHVNVKTDNKALKIRLKINNKFSEQSAFYSNDEEYASGTVYVPKILTKGVHMISLEYMSDSDNIGSKDDVSLKIIELDRVDLEKKRDNDKKVLIQN